MKIARWEKVWKNLSDNEIFCGFKCSECGYKAKKIYDDLPLGRFNLTEKCINCGAKMLESEDINEEVLNTLKTDPAVAGYEVVEI